ncbi:hypothetical protein IGI04_018886 [Brassica rapa subsp. trilocularis]|uniref:Uncharacterized protein n=1 Tax=Brassica rapa subsp. trilocularis TaxID=1813537 RepID=A0ABQ7ME77_BRACM|nr:hypothetical protein IGI04_018886 [Brassica rapa subsp. trilocularis]
MNSFASSSGSRNSPPSLTSPSSFENVAFGLQNVEAFFPAGPSLELLNIGEVSNFERTEP